MTVISKERGVAINAAGLSRRFGARTVIDGLDLDIPPGQFVAIVGRSGCGKSTLLRLLAGLDRADAGALQIDGQPLADWREDIRIMFQDARLLPWRRVLANVTLGLPEACAPQAAEVLDRVGLADRGGDWPSRLSGGQRQRVALARALAHQPRLLLLDEPLGALDALTRIEMHHLIEGLWQQAGFTAVLVTHDVHEAVALADRVLLVEDGRIALDEAIDLPRPRRASDPVVARLVQRVLDRVLQTPALETRPEPPQALVHPDLLRWAV